MGFLNFIYVNFCMHLMKMSFKFSQYFIILVNFSLTEIAWIFS